MIVTEKVQKQLLDKIYKVVDILGDIASAACADAFVAKDFFSPYNPSDLSIDYFAYEVLRKAIKEKDPEKLSNIDELEDYVTDAYKRLFNPNTVVHKYIMDEIMNRIMNSLDGAIAMTTDITDFELLKKEQSLEDIDINWYRNAGPYAKAVALREIEDISLYEAYSLTGWQVLFKELENYMEDPTARHEIARKMHEVLEDKEKHKKYLYDIRYKIIKSQK